MPEAVAPHHVPNRSFSGDVDCVGLRLLDASRHFTRAWQRASQARVGRHRQRWKPLGREEHDCDILLAGTFAERHQGAHHAIDLRVPCVGCDENAHHNALSMETSTRPRWPALRHRRGRSYREYPDAANAMLIRMPQIAASMYQPYDNRFTELIKPGQSAIATRIVTLLL